MLARIASPRGDLAAVAAVGALAVAGGLWGARGPRTLAVDIGPNDAPYVRGFSGEYEIEDARRGVRWSGYTAEVALPVTVSGPVAVSWRATRVLPEQAQVEVRLDGRTIDRFSCRGGAPVERRVELATLSHARAALAFAIDSHDRRGLGLRFDQVAFETGPGSRVVARGSALWAPAGAAAGILLALRLAGGTLAASTGLAAGLAATASAAWLLSPLFAAHLAGKLAVPVVLAAASSGLLLRRRPAGSVVVAVFVLGYLIKGAGVFHPATYYPDVQQHRRYLAEIRDAEGGLLERARTAQERLHWGERQVAGRPYLMPYSPLFYVPFLALPPRDDVIEDAMRHVALLAAAAEPVVVYFLATEALGPAAAPWAAALAASLAPLHSRLLLAMWPAVVGHFLDTLVILAALRYLVAPATATYSRLLVTALASLVTYIASLFNIGTFLAVLAALERRYATRLAAALATVVGVTVVGLYGRFALQLVVEILPALLARQPVPVGPAMAEPTGTLLAALARVPLFYGYAYPLLALAGLILVRRRGPGSAWSVLVAWGVAFGILVALRAFGAGLFRDLKEILFLGPWIAVLSAAALQALTTLGKRGKAAAAMVMLGLIFFGMARYRDFLVEYASPVTSGWHGSGTP